MNIEVIGSTGSGPSRMTALDTTLEKINMHQYNLVEYSSVIPPNGSVEVKEEISNSYSNGSAIGVVLAVDYVEPYSNEHSCAELVWNKPINESGYFLESEGRPIKQKEIEVMENNRNSEFKEDYKNRVEMISANDTNEDSFDCSLVMAVFGRINTEY